MGMMKDMDLGEAEDGTMYWERIGGLQKDLVVLRREGGGPLISDSWKLGVAQQLVRLAADLIADASIWRNSEQARALALLLHELEQTHVPGTSFGIGDLVAQFERMEN